jgi:FHS family L-fucose permease-like MFS transporter
MQGWPAATAMLSVGLFNSIMFPTLFALTLDRSSEPEKPAASGFLCLGIVGGAVISQAQGLLADRLGLQHSFLLPMACYLYVIVLAGFILKSPSPPLTESAQ